MGSENRINLSEDGEVLPPDPQDAEEAEGESSDSAHSPNQLDYEALFADKTPKGFFNLFRTIVTSPNEFFKDMPLEGGWLNPILFLAIVSTVNGLGQALVIMRPAYILEGFVIHMAWGFLSSGFMYLLCKAVGGGGSYQATYRAFAYASAISCIFWIPLVNLLAGIYSFYLLKIAMERVHDLPGNRVTLVLGTYLVAIAITVGVFTAMKLSAMKEAREQNMQKLGI